MSLKSNLYNFQFRLRQKFIGNYYKYLSVSEKRVNTKAFAPQKVLFVLSGLIGDSVMSMPVIIEARRIWRNSHFVVLGKKHNNELLAACPLIDEFYECNADPFSLRKSDEINRLQKWLGEQNFDAAIILLGDQFAQSLAKAKIPLRIGVKGTLLDSCLTHDYDIKSPRIWGTNERLNALRCLGYEVKNTPPKLWVNVEAKKTVMEKLSAQGLHPDERYVVLHPFGSTQRQWWKLERIVPFAKQLGETHNLKTVLIGGRETVSQISEQITDSIINTAGKLSLPELLAVIDGSRLVVTTDSGPFHIAGALQKPIIGLFRDRRPEHANAYSQSRVILGKEENCNNVCKWDYCSFNPCRQMQKINVEEVINLLNLVL